MGIAARWSTQHAVCMSSFLLAFSAMSGCLIPQEGPYEPPEHHVDMCIVIVHQEPPEGAFLLTINATGWQVNAPNLAQDVHEQANRTSPDHPGGACETYGPEIEWMLSRYKGVAGARSTETSPEFHRFFFQIVIDEDTTHILSVWGEPYGWERYPSE